MNHREHLVVFTRFPVPGEAKTRLIPALGAIGAAELQRRMTEHTVAQARKSGAHIEIRYTGSSAEEMFDWLGDDLHYAEQGGGDLGERMARAFQDQFVVGAKRVVIVGCDCPSNHWKNIQRSFQALENNDCVIGPAADGGYYLIGLSQPMSELFKNIEWGAKTVLAQTLAAAPCEPVLLPELGDVDLPADVPLKISVIIPTLNEAETISQTLEKVNEGFDVEVVMADGGSTDGTCDLVPDCLLCVKGRATQMNAGAAVATGELLLFLHADTDLPDNWDFMIRKVLSASGGRMPWVSLGAFRFEVKERLCGIEWVEWGTQLRSRFFGLPYGDQGLFLRRDTFEAIGGFPDQPILEDVELVRGARRIGRVVTLDASARTSGRRWQKLGVVRTTLRNQLILAGYALGVRPEKLRAFYG